MKRIFIVFVVITMFGCASENTKVKELEAKQIQLEQKIDSLQNEIKDLQELTKTHNEIITDMLKPKQGSLLDELDNQ
nr:hypothetical protein [uncultured Draconibacterium sp.]